MTSFNEFEDPINGFAEGPQDDFGLDGSAPLNNPLGLSDQDVQLEFDNFKTVSPTYNDNDAFPTVSPTYNPEIDEEEQTVTTEEPNAPQTPTYTPDASPPPDISIATRDDEDDLERNEHETPSQPAPSTQTLFGSDSEDEDLRSKPSLGNTGDADETQEEQGHGKGKKSAGGDDDNSDNASIKSDPADEKLTDFDLMMLKKSEERRQTYRRRKRGDTEFINDQDDVIQAMIAEMKKAADADRKANQRNECAFSKLTMLPKVVNSLQKQDLQTAFLDCGILSALADWLAPLPDGNLTHLKIRESVLKLLGDMTTVSPEQLKNSGIGKAVMLLFKHPKEMKENRAKAGKLIQEWSRPIFGTSANYRSMTREEREERDMDLMSENRRKSAGRSSTVDNDEEEDDEDEEGNPTPKRKRKAKSNPEGEDEVDVNKDIPRARVPQPSMKDYVIRPKSNLMMEATEGTNRRGSAKKDNRFEKRIRGIKEQQRTAKGLKGASVSLEGRKM
ncbi:hypothetical protein RvY_08320 [Ramazzottius varieornatus]|uniref:TFIIS N-terminal domain-containing protein n=1 Tax=Ramazzottius varieornatus TaxID=947166 RepID=A0A1D1V5F5_RAMVA|nr:hypothetical protein RvY_08320 [Ramazzottius varieornatus]